MKVRLLLVAEIEVEDESDPERTALSQIRGFGEETQIEFYEPAFGRTIDRGGCKSVEVFY